MLNAIGAAATGLLIVNPQVLFGASFQLTFLCVCLVAAVGIPILERTTLPFARGSRHLDSISYDLVLPAKVTQCRLELRMIAGRLHRWLGARIPLPALAIASRVFLGATELLVISTVMQIGLALPMAYYFHRATVVGLPANMLVLPLMEILMPAADARRSSPQLRSPRAARHWAGVMLGTWRCHREIAIWARPGHIIVRWRKN